MLKGIQRQVRGERIWKCDDLHFRQDQPFILPSRTSLALTFLLCCMNECEDEADHASHSVIVQLVFTPSRHSLPRIANPSTPPVVRCHFRPTRNAHIHHTTLVRLDLLLVQIPTPIDSIHLTDTQNQSRQRIITICPPHLDLLTDTLIKVR
jgi:hypothetical protein